MMHEYTFMPSICSSDTSYLLTSTLKSTMVGIVTCVVQCIPFFALWFFSGIQSIVLAKDIFSWEKVGAILRIESL